MPKLLLIFLLSIVMAVMVSVAVVFTKYYDMIGWYLVGSKGCSSAILLSGMFLMFFMSHDIMTILRRKCKNYLSGWLDHYFIIHKFGGYLLTFYCIIHTACHLGGSFRIISQADNVEEINKNLSYGNFDTKPTYLDLLFKTIPGVTGVILLVIIVVMAITSTHWIRQRYFQLFGYTHMLLFPIFLIVLIIHGFGFWFTIGTPLAIIVILPGLVALVVQMFMRMFADKINNFKIIDISISSDCTYMMVYFSKPENYRLVHGQYVFLGVPGIHPMQWHPFTVASSPNSPYLTLMIKKAGDWSGKLIKHLHEGKLRMMKSSEFKYDRFSDYDVFNLLHDLHQEIPLKEMADRNKLFYPKVKISKACSTPNDTFINRKNVIMVGAGSGISPYLGLLEEVIRDDKGKKNEFNFESARLVFVAREGEQISWISNYLFHIINAPWIIPKLEFNIFLTLEKNLKTLPSFLFWRAFLLISLSKQVCSRNKKNALPTLKYDPTKTFIDKKEFDESPIKVLFGRPNFEVLFKSMITPDCKKVHVYSTSSTNLNKLLFNTAHKLSKETNVKFKHIYESTS